MRMFARTSLVVLASLFLAHAAHAAGEPSEGAHGVAGARGVIVFEPTDRTPGVMTWWIDTDGVEPGEAGCHIGATEAGEPNGRMFGEACRDQIMLVESSPGADELHSHKDDIGHPDTFDCNDWCGGEGFAGGVCVPTPAPPCEESARCVCN